MVVPHLRTVPLLAARCSVAAHCASLRVLGTSALRAFGRSQARLRLSLVTTIRNSRLASLPLASLPPLSSAWSLRIVRKLTRGSPCFTGLIGGYCTLTSQWSSCCALRLAVLPPLSSAWSPLCVRKAHLRCFLLHWAHRRLLQPLAAPPLSPSLDFRFACFAHSAHASCATLVLSLGVFDSLRPLRKFPRNGLWNP